MNRFSRKAMQTWVGMGTNFLPFADAATEDLPLSRLLRLSLFQVTVGMALTLLVGTLNRVMIVELNVPASVVSVMIALPLLFAPFRALIGFKSDVHRSALGWRRVPYIWRGTLVQFGGLAIMPFALLVLSGTGETHPPMWAGEAAAALAFLMVGAGLHIVQTCGLALATDLAATESQPKVVGLMYVMLLFGMIASAFVFGALLHPFSAGRLIQVVQGTAVVTITLNGIALWKQETRHAKRPEITATPPTFRGSWAAFVSGGSAIRRLVVVGLGTLGFSMEDVLLEPYGGQVLHLMVSTTTKLTATWALGGLLGFALASRVLARGFDPFRMATYGALVGIPAFAAVIASAPTAACGPVRYRHAADRLRLRLVQPRHTHRHHEHRAEKPDWPGAGGLGRRYRHLGRCGRRPRRRHPRCHRRHRHPSHARPRHRLHFRLWARNRAAVRGADHDAAADPPRTGVCSRGLRLLPLALAGGLDVFVQVAAIGSQMRLGTHEVPQRRGNFVEQDIGDKAI
jgi:BCD family chlorophyll transporter-like MFS transporter